MKAPNVRRTVMVILSFKLHPQKTFIYLKFNILLLGKRQKRYSWSNEEKNTATDYFHDEIFYGDPITRKKVKEFYELNQEIYKRRTPHLIMQWVKNKYKEVLAKENGHTGIHHIAISYADTGWT